MPIAKAATNVQLASLVNRLRLTLIRDRMTEFLCMATKKEINASRDAGIFLYAGNPAAGRKSHPPRSHGRPLSHGPNVGGFFSNEAKCH